MGLTLPEPLAPCLASRGDSTAVLPAGSQPEAPVPPILQGEDASLAACEPGDGSGGEQRCTPAGRPGSAPHCPQPAVPEERGHTNTVKQTLIHGHGYIL